MVHGDKGRAQGRALPKGQARQNRRTRRDWDAFCCRLRCVRLGGRQEDALPGAFPIHSDAFAARLPGLAVNPLHGVSGRIVGQIDGGGDGLINMALQRRLHEHPFFRVDAMGRGKKLGQVSIGSQVMGRPVLHCQRMHDGELAL